MTTFDALNESGVFIATVDGANHATITPTRVYGSVLSWYYDKNFHPYTFVLEGLCVRVN